VLIGWAQYTTCKMSVTYRGRSLAAEGQSGGAGTATLRLVAADYTPQQVSELLAQDAIQLIDVRQPHEHDAGRIAGGRLIELGQLSGEAQTIDRSRPVVFYCRSGGRSAMATQAFEEAGFDAHNMTGGLLAWDAAGLPMEPDGGFVDEP
jgi:rhodanese-related sulfurtransferase